MAFPGNVAKIVFSGALPGGERWAVGLYHSKLDESVTAQAWADTIAAGTGATWPAKLKTAFASLCGTGTNLNRVNTYFYATGRQAVDTGQATMTGYTGSGSVNSGANQLCLVSTLRTASATRTGRGRMYWPCNQVTAVGNGLVDSTRQQQLADAVADLCAEVNALVVSETATISRLVTSVTVDNVPDIQRSRAQQLSRSRVTVAVSQ